MTRIRSAVAGMCALAWRGLSRRPVRSCLVTAGVAVAVFLFCTVDAMRAGVERATGRAAGETSLVVYRQNRFCPFTSQLPQHYAEQIRRIPGVAAAVPVKIVVSNCRASLDVVTFRGVPADSLTGVGCDLRWWHSLAMAAAQFCVRLPLVYVVSLAFLLKSYADLAPAYAELAVPYARVHRTAHMPVGHAPYARLRALTRR